MCRRAASFRTAPHRTASKSHCVRTCANVGACVCSALRLLAKAFVRRWLLCGFLAAHSMPKYCACSLRKRWCVQSSSSLRFRFIAAASRWPPALSDRTQVQHNKDNAVSQCSSTHCRGCLNAVGVIVYDDNIQIPHFSKISSSYSWLNLTAFTCTFSQTLRDKSNHADWQNELVC